MNPHITELLKDLSLMDETDITIKTAGKDVKAHSYILKARSAVFRAMLNSDMKEAKEKVIRMTTYNEAAVTELMQYMKCAKAPESNLGVEIIFELHELAEQYALVELEKATLTMLNTFASKVSTAITLLHYTSNDAMRTSCLNTINTGIKGNSTDVKIKLECISDGVKKMIFDHLLKAGGLIDTTN